jgi:hypothetical protein
VGNFDVRVSYVDGMKRQMVFAGKVKDRDELISIMERYHVECGVIDSMPEGMLAQEIQTEAGNIGCNLWLCRYSSEGEGKKPTKDFNNKVLNVDRTQVLDRSLSRIKAVKNILPVNYKGICNGEYFKEMMASVRQLETDKKGNQKYSWTKCKDHSRHADTYDMLAAEMMMDNVIDEVSVG